MTDPIDRIRDVGASLPECVIRDEGDGAALLVDGVAFATAVRGDDGVVRLTIMSGTDASTAEAAIRCDEDADWPAIEDAIARAWELTAPARLLEVGGR